jgi:choice-of-anchor A domain-containing protein
MAVYPKGLPTGRASSGVCIGLALACLMAMAGLSQAAVVSPGDFNVYSLGNIGSAAKPYGSDFQGVAGAAGNAYFSSFTLTGLNKINGNVLFTGGSASLNGGDFLGSVSVGGDVTLQNYSVGGNIVSGGKVTATGGQISGAVTAGSSVNLSNVVPGGTVSANTAYTSPINYTAMNQYFLNTSADIAGLANTGVITNSYGELSYTAVSGVNVLSIDAASLKNAWGFNVTGPADAIIYINVTGSDVSLDWLTWDFSGGLSADDVLLNYYQASTFTLDQGGTTNILAPNASLTYSSGVWTGSIVAGNLYGGGQVNLGGFDHYSPVPEPVTLSLLAIGSLAIIRRRHK